MLYDVPDGSQSFKTPGGVEYHLITLDKNGEFTCRSGGEDSWIHIPDLY